MLVISIPQELWSSETQAKVMFLRQCKPSALQGEEDDRVVALTCSA